MNAPSNNHGGVYAGTGPAALVERAGWRQGARRSSVDADKGQGPQQRNRVPYMCRVMARARPGGLVGLAEKGGIGAFLGRGSLDRKV